METLLALSIAVSAALFFGSFLIPQMEFYYGYDRKSQGRTMCSGAYVKLEEILRYGYMYVCSPLDTEKLFYFTRDEGPGAREGRENKWSELPAYNTWPSLTAEDLDIRSLGGMSLELDFEGTTVREVNVRIRAVKDGDTVYEQEAVIKSLYWYDISEGGAP